MSAKYIPSKYRKKDSLEYKGLEKEDQNLLDCVKHYTGINIQKIPERVRTKCTHEENLFIPEKWVR